MMDAIALLNAYDAQLRREAELGNEIRHDEDGPLLRAVLTRSRGFVTYRDLGGLTGAKVDDLISRTVSYFRERTHVDSFEWKTRGHDVPADLGQRLAAYGLLPERIETVMVGEAEALALEVPQPDGVVIREVGDTGEVDEDVQRMVALQDLVFGAGRGPSAADVIAAIQRDPGNRWIALAEQEVVAAGRLGVVSGTDFAGLWGGSTHPRWRGRGIYRALVAARAQAARAQGVRYLHSDCTAFSRPILERSGMVAITTTTPYIWSRTPREVAG